MKSIRCEKNGSRKLWDEGLKWPISGRLEETRTRIVLIDSAALFPSPLYVESPFPLSILSRGRTINAFTWAGYVILTVGKKSVFRVRLKVAGFLGFPKDAIPLDPDYAWILSLSLSIYLSIYLSLSLCTCGGVNGKEAIRPVQTTPRHVNKDAPLFCRLPAKPLRKLWRGSNSSQSVLVFCLMHETRENTSFQVLYEVCECWELWILIAEI